MDAAVILTAGFSSERLHIKSSQKQVKDLVNKGKTEQIKGFKKKSGDKFDAMLRLENGKIAFAFA